MDLRRLVQAMRRYRIIVVAVAVLGLAAGVGYTFVKPPTLTSQALVWLPTTKNVQTSVLIADSTSVLEGAALTLQPHVPLATMRKQVKVGNLTANILSISASANSSRRLMPCTSLPFSSTESLCAFFWGPDGRKVAFSLSLTPLRFS